MSAHARQCRCIRAQSHRHRTHSAALDAVARSRQKTPFVACHGNSIEVLHFARYDAPMTTTKPRITVNLEPVTALQLKRISQLTGSSQSSMIAEVLEQAAPVFERLIVVLEAAEKAREQVKESSVARLTDAQRRIESQLGLVLDDFDKATAPLLAEVEKVKRRRRTGAQAGARTAAAATPPTPISNRGVRLDPKAMKDIAQLQEGVRPEALKVRVKNRGGK